MFWWSSFHLKKLDEFKLLFSLWICYCHRPIVLIKLNWNCFTRWMIRERNFFCRLWANISVTKLSEVRHSTTPFLASSKEKTMVSDELSKVQERSLSYLSDKGLKIGDQVWEFFEHDRALDFASHDIFQTCFCILPVYVSMLTGNGIFRTFL